MCICVPEGDIVYLVPTMRRYNESFMDSKDDAGNAKCFPQYMVLIKSVYYGQYQFWQALFVVALVVAEAQTGTLSGWSQNEIKVMLLFPSTKGIPMHILNLFA